MTGFKLKPFNRNISDEELIKDLQLVAKKLGKNSVLYSEYPTHGRCASRVFETRFGSWNLALESAGLKINRKYASDEELFNNLEKVWIAVGRQPRKADFKKPLSQFSYNTYASRFGGWRKALEQFVTFMNNNEEVLFEKTTRPQLKNKSRDPNLRMRWRVMNRDDFRCQTCGRSPANEPGTILHLDHIKPWSKGGLTEDDNLQVLCERCNLGKGDAVIKNEID